MLQSQERGRIVAYYSEMDGSFAHWGSAGAYQMHYGYKDSPEDEHFASLARMDAATADRAKLQPGQVVLDAGCGVGASALWLAANRDVHVHGISVSPLQVLKARREAGRRGLSNRANFSVRDYTSTGFADASFDIVWGVESVCHAPRKLEFLREAFRLLRPGGRLVVVDYFRPAEKVDLDEAEEAVLRTWADGWVMAVPPALVSFRDAMARVGFVGIQADDWTDAIRADAAEMDRRGREGLAEDLHAGSDRRIAHVRACLAQKAALDHGLWRYTVVTGEK